MPLGSYKKTEPQKEEKKVSHPVLQKASIAWSVIQPKYKMSDIILEMEIKAQIEDAISYFQNKELLFVEWGLRERFSGHEGLSINLYGPPGTGKTMAAHAIAAELNLPMICVDYAEIESKYVGETAKNLSALFQIAKEENALIFFDEADALLSKRVTNMTSSTDVSVNQTRSVLLNLLNYYQGVIVFATNFIQNFDAAFLRRIKYHIKFELPNQQMREQLWRLYVPEQMPHNLDFMAIAEKFDGVSGSDISNAVFAAAVSAARQKEEIVSAEKFETSIQRMLTVKQANMQKRDVSVTTRNITEEEMRVKLGQEEEK